MYLFSSIINIYVRKSNSDAKSTIFALLIKYGQPHSTLQSVCIPTKYNLKIKLTQSLRYMNYMGKKSNTEKYILEKLDNNARKET